MISQSTLSQAPYSASTFGKGGASGAILFSVDTDTILSGADFELKQIDLIPTVFTRSI